MSTHTAYRLCIWLPILVPVSVISVSRALGSSIADGIVREVLFYSLVYGGLPYAALGVWATWWIGGRSEGEIRRLMFRAPLLMTAVFALVAVIIGALVGRLGPFVALAMLGSVAILLLGYAYVGVTVLLMRGLRASAASSRMPAA